MEQLAFLGKPACAPKPSNAEFLLHESLEHNRTVNPTADVAARNGWVLMEEWAQSALLSTARSAVQVVCSACSEMAAVDQTLARRSLSLNL